VSGELISREQLERIVKRAAELQAGEREIGDGLTERELLALGKDVGIPDRYLRQAMLEERTRTAPEPAAGGWSWLTGPATLVAHRVVPGDRATVESALARCMEEDALLQPKRRFPDRTSWEPKVGAFASIQRALAGRSRFPLARVSEVTGQVVQLEPGFCLVRLEANIRQQRAARISGASVLLVIGWGLSGGLLGVFAAPLLFPQLLALLPGVALTGGALAAARSYRGPNERTLVGLEQVLDRLERGEVRGDHALPAAGPFGRIAGEVLKAFKD
jgi:hypothetical protein